MLADPWLCPSCRLKEYGQLMKLLVNTVETIKPEVASLKKQVNSKSCLPQEDPRPSQYAVMTSGATTTISPWHFGITGDLWHWFRACLTDRKQYVFINNCYSSLLPVISGVPQGIVYSALYFSLFLSMTFLTVILNSTMLLFAADAKCSLPISRQSDFLFNMTLMFWQCGQNTGTRSLTSLSVLL